ncbi:MAG: hypothetical protein IJA07_08000 [Agathobacter sp.]|nr:hypothetical protein [Agathobacter sp.]
MINGVVMDNRIGENVKTYRNVIIRSSNIEDGVLLADEVFVTDSDIGKKCKLERRTMVFNSVIGSLTSIGVGGMVRYAKIGKVCSIAWNVSIGGAEHDYKKLTISSFPYDPAFGISEGGVEHWYNKPVEIGNDVWIAANACITRGVTIGDGAVIGAGSIVTHDVPAYEIWAGVPAKKIGQRFSDEIIAELLELKWWDLSEDILRDNITLFQENVTLENIGKIKAKLK